MKVALRGGGDLERALSEAGVDVVDVDEATVVVAVGERALLDLATTCPSTPIVAVDTGVDRYGLSTDTLRDGLDALFDGNWSTVRHPVLSVSVGRESIARAVSDVMLITSEPARISEYAVRFGEESAGVFRSDGVVVATPLGSRGYARAAGGPILEPGSGYSVVPISPFATNWDTWVAAGDVTLSVERDDGDVVLVVDGREHCEVTPHERVSIERVGSVSLLDPAEF